MFGPVAVLVLILSSPLVLSKTTQKKSKLPTSRIKKNKTRVEHEWDVITKTIDNYKNRLEKELRESKAKNKVVHKIKVMYEVGRIVRNYIRHPDVQGYRQNERKQFVPILAKKMKSIDDNNLVKFRKIIDEHGWPTISKFGKVTDRRAWFLAQHAESAPKFQKKILRMLGELYLKGETNAKNYAYLYDQVKVREKKKQRFGTQGKCSKKGIWIPFALESKKKLHKRRQNVGLVSLKDFQKMFESTCLRKLKKS